MTTPTPPAADGRRLRDYGPVQACDRLSLARFQFDRAIAAGLIPPASRPSWRWPAAVIEDAATRVAEIAAAVGSVPDVGAVRAAEVLSARLGIDVTPDAVAELHRMGALPQVGTFKDHPLYCGRALEAFTDTGALALAERAGELLTRDGAAARLGIRRTDLDHLIRAGRVVPAAWGRSSWRSRRHGPDVPLYRAADVDALTGHPDIDWPAVRATPLGRRSPLAALARALRDQAERDHGGGPATSCTWCTPSPRPTPADPALTGRYLGGPLDGRPVERARRSAYRDTDGATLACRVRGWHLHFYRDGRAVHASGGHYERDGRDYRYVPGVAAPIAAEREAAARAAGTTPAATTPTAERNA